jgi:glycine cleavage system H protein
MSKVLEGLFYAKSHEWCKIEDGVATFGISDYAQDSLGAIVYVDAGVVGEKVKQGVSFGAVESVKAASDIIAPLSGEIIEVNEEIVDDPEKINKDPYSHWLIKVLVNNESEVGNLLNSSSYQELIK